MAIDYDTLTGTKATVGSILYLANHTDLPVANILTEAQAYIYERLRAREMRVTARLAIAEGEDAVDLPTGFLAPVSLRWDGNTGEVDYVHENLLRRWRTATAGELESGEPCEYTINDEQLQFEVKADDDYEGDFVYYEIPDALATGANNTNFLTRRFPTLLRQACMAFAWSARNRADMFASALAGPMGVDTLIDQANIAADMSRMGQRMRASR